MIDAGMSVQMADLDPTMHDDEAGANVRDRSKV